MFYKLLKEQQGGKVLQRSDNRFVVQAMKFLQTAIGLRGYAQRDPLTEYKLEGYNLFLDMMANIRRNVVYNVFVLNPKAVKLNSTGGGTGGPPAPQSNGKPAEQLAAAKA